MNARDLGGFQDLSGSQRFRGSGGQTSHKGYPYAVGVQGPSRVHILPVVAFRFTASELDGAGLLSGRWVQVAAASTARLRATTVDEANGDTRGSQARRLSSVHLGLMVVSDGEYLLNIQSYYKLVL